jgi:hypothetical protein
MGAAPILQSRVSRANTSRLFAGITTEDNRGGSQACGMNILTPHFSAIIVMVALHAAFLR